MFFIPTSRKLCSLIRKLAVFDNPVFDNPGTLEVALPWSKDESHRESLRILKAAEIILATDHP